MWSTVKSINHTDMQKNIFLLIPLLLLTSCTMIDSVSSSLEGNEFIIFIIFIILLFNVILPYFYPKFWKRSNKWQKYPDWFYKDITISLPSFWGNPFDTIQMKLRKKIIWCEKITGTIEFSTKKSCYIEKLDLEIDTNHEQMNTWIEVNDEWEITWRSIPIFIKKDCIAWMPEVIEFNCDLLTRLDTRDQNVKEGFESYRNIDDIDLQWERDDMKQWFKNPVITLRTFYKNKEVWKSDFTLNDPEVQNYIEWL